jgi:hypothetical protein
MAKTIRCANCGDENPADARFCIDCSASLVPVATGETTRLPAQRCPSCGSANPQEARFCVVCGRGLAGAQPQPAARPQPQPAPQPPRPVAAPRHSPRQHSYPRVATSPVPTPIAPVQPPHVQHHSWNPTSVGPILFVVGIFFLLMRGNIWPGVLWLLAISSFIGAAASGRSQKALTGLVWWGGIALLFATKAFWPGILILVFLCMMINGRGHSSGWW